MPLEPFTSPLGIKNAKHLLNRATFGADKSQIDTFAALTPEQALNQLLQTKAEPPPPNHPTRGEPINFIANGEPGPRSDVNLAITRWFFTLMLEDGASLREKIVWFMHTLFTSDQQIIARTSAFYCQIALFRKFAGDSNSSLREFTKKVCLDLGMVIFLDTSLNTKDRPQENFGRELIELYTVGRGRNIVPPGIGDYGVFKQTDVEQATLVMTGWNRDESYSNIDPATGLPRAVRKTDRRNTVFHNNDPKTFSEYFGNTTITPDPALLNEDGEPTTASMLQEISDMVDMFYESTETAMHICRKVYRFFCNYNITDEIDNNIIRNLAATFKDSGWQLHAVIADLLKSKHFYDSGNADNSDDNHGALIKPPFELVLGTLRFFGFNRESQFDKPIGNLNFLMRAAREAGINFYSPVEVAGYPPYHQPPDYNRLWINANNLAERYQFIRIFLNNRGQGAENMNFYGLVLDIIAFIESTISNPSDINVLVDELVLYLFPLEISSERRSYFKLVLNDDLPDLNWTMEWNNRNAADSEVTSRLRGLLDAMMQSPEYQVY